MKRSCTCGPVSSKKDSSQRKDTNCYLEQSRYSKSLDHLLFPQKKDLHCSAYSFNDYQNSRPNQTSLESEQGTTNSSIDLALNGVDKKYRQLVSKNLSNVKQKCQKLVKSLSHTPSESTQHIFRSSSAQIMNGLQSKTSSDSEEDSFLLKNEEILKKALIFNVITLRKVRSAGCLGEYISSVVLSGTESLPNMNLYSEDNIRYVDITSYSSSSSCTSEQSGWVSSQSSSVTSLDTNRSVKNGGVLDWIELDKFKRFDFIKVINGKENACNGKGYGKYRKIDRKVGTKGKRIHIILFSVL